MSNVYNSYIAYNTHTVIMSNAYNSCITYNAYTVYYVFSNIPNKNVFFNKLL